MRFVKYKIGEITTVSAGGDKPPICSERKTTETPIPIFSNGLDNEGLYGYTNQAKIEDDTVTVTARGVNVGTACYRTEPFLPIVRLLSLVPNREIVDAKYLYYLLRNTHITGTGSAQPQITVPMISKLDIEIHKDLTEQKKIADFLYLIDKKIMKNEAINRNLSDQADSIWREFYEKQNTSVVFTELINVLGGGTPKTKEKKYWNGDIPFFTPKDVGNPYTFSTEKTITEDGLNKCNSRLYPANTTFVTARGTVGKTSLAGISMAMNQSCYALASEKIHPLLVYFYTLEIVRALRHKASGAVFDAIVTRDFKTETVKVFDDETKRDFLEIVTPMYERIHLNSIENLRLIETRDSLLPKLMSGELDVSDIDI